MYNEIVGTHRTAHTLAPLLFQRRPRSPLTLLRKDKMRAVSQTVRWLCTVKYRLCVFSTQKHSPALRLKVWLDELTMTSLVSLVMSPDDTSKASWPICIWYTPREVDKTGPKVAETSTRRLSADDFRPAILSGGSKQHQWLRSLSVNNEAFSDHAN